ncbi:hypothetical protein [Ekhidna sp.]|uniref:hypothetical protein n=1 Tax=Ekhidna sp. TaxID=2608089 RepID=UPI0032993B0F
MKVSIFLIVFLLTLVPYDYPNNPIISNKLREPRTDSTHYFPLELFIDSIEWADRIDVKIDTSKVEWFSDDLWFSDEPVLYNYFLDREIYRLTWLRSFHPAIILRLERNNGNIILLEKKMTFIEPWKPVPEHRRQKLDTSMVQSSALKRAILDGKIGTPMEWNPDSSVVETNILKVSNKTWQEFQRLLEDKRFDRMPTTRAWGFGTDGSEWILEKHFENEYHVVNRWSPDNNSYSNFREIGDFLIDLSSYKNEERY